MITRLVTVPLLLCCLLFVACSKTAPADTYAGKYKGRGASEEVRFNRPGILTLTVKHNTDFSFKIDPAGNVTGDGQITYDLTPNTQGLDSIVASVRGAMSMTPGAAGAAMSAMNQAADVAGKAADASDAAGNTGRKRPGGLSYTATHLKNGPEIRYFHFKGHVDKTSHDGEQQLRLTLEIDGDYKRPDGTADPKLIAEYEVNGEKTETSFPCWSPFLKGFGTLKKGDGGVWSVEFSEKGTHRNDTKVWQEYGYYWLAQQRD